ncbi:MAG: alpha-glucan family phosphorylase [Sulfuricaulis sp.]|nr:alpha-glucan family phosphorylase [Sulfuricaulis sp.]
MLDDFIHEPRVAYFSMEIALRNEIPTYAGGLGVLAGDTVRSAADLALPLVAVSLVSRAGYFRQEIDAQGRQVERPTLWEPREWAQSLDAKIAVPIEGRAVWIGAWLYVLEGHMGGSQPVLLLDTDLEENRREDREITHTLYGGDETYRLKQEIVLGVGGMRLLQALGFTIRHYHMNEGHSALLGLELLRRYLYPPEDLRPGESPYDLPRVRKLCSFTTHTPVEAGHDRFAYELVQRVLGNVTDVEVAKRLTNVAEAQRSRLTIDEGLVDLATLKHLAGEDSLNMTRLALNLSEYVNGVAKRHAEISKTMFPGYQVHAITNGVHPFTWTSESFRKLYDRYLPSWCHEPEQLVRADCCIPDAAVWEAHVQAKQVLIEKVRTLTGIALHPKIPILGFARRMTAYKRPDLLFSDLERLKAIARNRSFQVVLAGKAHPRDEDGKRLIEQLHAQARALEGSIPVAYLPDYDIETALALVSGADLWLNTPLRPFEASGTSGMKAAFNGVPSLSVLDGWWVEGCIEGVTGWAIGNAAGADDGDARALYDKLEQVVLPLYYGYAQDPGGWIKVMKGAICKNASYFNSHRMMRRYATEAYIR